MKVFDRVAFREWHKIAEQCKYATFFHTFLWAQIFSATYPQMKIATKKFIFDDGRVALLPLIKTKRYNGLINSYISTPAGVYGGIISNNIIKQEDFFEIAVSLKKANIASISITCSPFSEYNFFDAFKTTSDFTHVLSLGKDDDKIWHNFKYSNKKQINKGRRAGLICQEAKDLEEWREYYSIYQNALKRWGDSASSRYPFSLFENMFNAQSSRIKLWLVVFEGKIVGGNLNFYHNKHCVEWHASFLSDYFKHGIRNFLVNNIILDANARGYRYYDFNPSGGHEGTARFKESFGSNKLRVLTWTWKNPLIAMIARVKQKLF